MLTVSVPLDVWLEALDVRIDDNRAAQAHCLAFSPKGHVKLVGEADLEPGRKAMRGNANWVRGEKKGCQRGGRCPVLMSTTSAGAQGRNRGGEYSVTICSDGRVR